MPHSIRIEDSIYEKLSLFCKENGIKINEFCNRAIRDTLSLKMYGDAPFLQWAEVDNHPKNTSFTLNNPDKNSEHNTQDIHTDKKQMDFDNMNGHDLEKLSPKEANERITKVLSENTHETHIEGTKQKKRRL